MITRDTRLAPHTRQMTPGGAADVYPHRAPSRGHMSTYSARPHKPAGSSRPTGGAPRTCTGGSSVVSSRSTLEVEKRAAELAFRSGSSTTFLFYQHVPKSGGHWFCNLAKAAGARQLTVTLQGACCGSKAIDERLTHTQTAEEVHAILAWHISRNATTDLFRQRCREPPDHRSAASCTCDVLQQQMPNLPKPWARQEERASAQQNVYGLEWGNLPHPPRPAAGLVYVFVLRAPVAHYLAWMQAFMSARRQQLLMGAYDHAAPLHRANWFVRALVGHRYGSASYGTRVPLLGHTVTLGHVAEAQHVLEAFSLVVALEHAPAASAAACARLGWCGPRLDTLFLEAQQTTLQSNAKHMQALAITNTSRATLRHLCAALAPDLQLYSHVVSTFSSASGVPGYNNTFDMVGMGCVTSAQIR